VCPGQNKRIAPLPFYDRCRKRQLGLIARTPEIDCNQTAMGIRLSLLEYSSILVKRKRLGGISDMALLPLRQSRVNGMYVCIKDIELIIVTNRVLH
jgi:hypothetical protein